MERKLKPIVILMADDDPDDRLSTQQALDESRVANDFYTVEDGEELINYLSRQGKYADEKTAPLPGVFLLDLNMPKKSGREALQEIKSNPELRPIPIVVLTTAKAEEDIFRSYDLGANSFISKPITFEGLVEAMRSLGRYRFEIVELPAENNEN